MNSRKSNVTTSFYNSLITKIENTFKKHKKGCEYEKLLLYLDFCSIFIKNNYNENLLVTDINLFKK